ncbi:MAG: SH3 domain-containing protein [Clostridia bacterium]|nr:SH3 domain-containing protein [Clostridia bacterium]
MRKIKKIITLILMLIILTNIIIVPTNSYASENGIKAGQVAVTSGKLNVRKKPDIKSEVLKQIKKEKYITLISKQGSWWKVKYNKTSYGYCHSDYIKVVSENERQVSVSSSLNVRKSASTTSKIKDTLQNGERVVVLETKGDFNKVLYYGMKTGFVNKNYLKTKSESNINYEKQALKVPDFKQTDSRWANVKIGKSGKTIGRIGCATTAIAMMESYRKNKNIYPDVMSKKLSYSSTGNVYWPSDYEVVTSSSNYLKGIYERLKQNKPVLFGAKKSSGAQHWVVITGFNGGNTLTTSAFTINDPGSKSRKTLKQFLNDYPSFYKYFYY